MAFSYGGNQPPGGTGSFSFSQPQPTTTGFAFGTNTQTPSFSFGAATTTQNFSFGGTPSAPTTVSSIGANPAVPFGQLQGFGLAPNTTAGIGFGFSTPATATTMPFGGFKAAAPTSTATSTIPGSISFGGTTGFASMPSLAGSTFGQPAPAMMANFGQPQANPASTLSSFGQPPNVASTFGQTPSAAAPLSTFGQTPSATAPLSTFGQPTSAVASLPTFGQQTNAMTSLPAYGQATNTATSLPAFGTLPASQPLATQGLQLGGTPLGGFSITTSAAIPASGGITNFSAAIPTTGSSFAPTSTFSITSGTQPSTAAPLPSFGAALSMQQPPKVSLVPATSATTSLPSAPSTASFATTTALTFGAAATATFTTASATSLVIPTTTAETTVEVAKSTTFSQLEESINKWNVELEEQERIFLSQATQVNAWDRLLVSNGEKITSLNESVERVKLEQQRLDHELDFIVAQQRELEELLTPLEKSVDASPSLSIQQHADLEREHTYHLAENVDGQLKRMSEDIKKIIEHLNTVSHENENEPMQQISKILNAHMDALQWIDHSTDSLHKKVDEVSKMLQTTRKDYENTYKIGYE